MFREEPRRIVGYKYSLRLKNYTPIRAKPYPILISKQAAVEAKIKRMIDMDITEKSSSPYSVPIVPVLKKMERYGYAWTLGRSMR